MSSKTSFLGEGQEEASGGLIVVPGPTYGAGSSASQRWHPISRKAPLNPRSASPLIAVSLPENRRGYDNYDCAG